MRRARTSFRARKGGMTMADTGESRAERLKAALRDNLRRRKAQERGKEQGKERSGGTGTAGPRTLDDSRGDDASGSGPDSDKTGL